MIYSCSNIQFQLGGIQRLQTVRIWTEHAVTGFLRRHPAGFSPAGGYSIAEPAVAYHQMGREICQPAVAKAYSTVSGRFLRTFSGFRPLLLRGFFLNFTLQNLCCTSRALLYSLSQRLSSGSGMQKKTQRSDTESDCCVGNGYCNIRGETCPKHRSPRS